MDSWAKKRLRTTDLYHNPNFGIGAHQSQGTQRLASRNKTLKGRLPRTAPPIQD